LFGFSVKNSNFFHNWFVTMARTKTSAKPKTTKPKTKPRVVHGSVQGVTNGAIKRMSYKAGVRKISAECNDEVRNYIDNLVEELVREAHIHMSTAGRNTLSSKDAINAITDRGHQFAYSSALADRTKSCKAKTRTNKTRK